MKKILLLSTISFTILLFTGCSDSNVPANYTASLSGYSLYIADDNFKFNSQGGVVNTTVNTHNSAWQFSGVPSWLTVTPKSGNTTAAITITASENLSADTARTSIFYLESNEEGWKYKLPIHVTQEAASSYITPSSKTVSFTGSKGSQTISVLSNIEWTVSSSTSWVNAEKSMDKTSVIIKVEANPTDVSRTACVTLDGAGRVTSTIQITQEAAGVTGSTETIEFERDASSKSISITADAPWTTKTSGSWISVSPESGDAGSYSLNIKVTENSSVNQRTGYVYVNIGSSTKLQVPVIQKGIYIESDTESITFTADSETKQIAISSNTEWDIMSYPEWLKVSPLSGINKQVVSVISQKNFNVSSRSGVIKIGKDALSVSTNINVKQEGMTLSVDNNLLQFSNTASSQEVLISTIAEWSASTSDGWIHLSPTSGIGNTTIMVSVDENTGENNRAGSIRLTSGELSQNISVVQQGSYFNISTSSKTFDSHGGTLQLSFSTNEQWTATISDNASWISLSSTSGNGDATIDITASDNASMKKRNATLFIKPLGSQGVSIPIIQEGRFLKINVQEIAFGREGGTSENVEINTDGTYTISSNEEWVNINKKGENVYSLVASANQGAIRQTHIVISMTGLFDGETYIDNILVYQDGLDTNGHNYVDLGLPSGTLWATCNVGTNSPTGTGDFYSWGETTKKQNYSSSTYKYLSNWNLTKYCTQSSRGTVDNKTTLDFSDDVANKQWGGSWQIPSYSDFEELSNYCNMTNTTQNSISGLLITGPNGRSIFLPQTGYYNDTGEFSKYGGYYWTNTLCNNQNFYAYYFLVQPYTGQQSFVTNGMRYCGMVVRPVCK